MNARLLASFALAALLGFVTLPAAHADDADQATLFRFGGPVRVPGHVLRAGSYWFVLMDHGDTPGVVQIFKADRTTLVGTILTINADRLEVTGDTEVSLTEPSRRSRSSTPALLTWFYPGHMAGHEFLYSGRRERRIQHEREEELSLPADGQTGTVSGD
jgi:hypothetical protein